MLLPAGRQSPHSRKSIEYSKVLVVEGRDDFEFFIALLRNLGLLPEIEVRNAGGEIKEEYLKTLIATRGFPNVVSLGIVRDAEKENAKSAFDSVCNGLKKVGLSVPEKPLAVVDGEPNVSVYIMPDCENPGMLETLCLESVNNSLIISCIDQYFQCIENKNIHVPDNMFKARFHTFLSAQEEPGLLLGEAAHRGYLPWDNPAFDSIKDFLRSL